MKVLEKNKIRELLNHLIDHYELIAPIEKDNSIINFDKIENAKDVKLEFYNSNDAPKKLFFPQTEELFTFSNNGKVSPPELKTDMQRILFGLRPCDVESLLILDKIFDSDDYKDPYYTEKRENTLIFTMTCNRPQNSCFCTSFSSGPFSKNNSDVFIVDLEDKYIFDSVTEKGIKILDKIPNLKNADENIMIKLKKMAEKAEERIKYVLDIKNLNKKLSTIFDDQIWNNIHEKCLGCGVCTFSCPTCHCFDILDEQTNNNGKRIRIWDSCMNSNFTLEASGHNPRPTGKERMRQRIMHKFSYFYKNFNKFACVGCGRCIRSCPVGMSIRKVIEMLSKT
jgi:sulfhydrogenase subunit beta (sulfur reductase)